ncbi:transcription antitermination protein NusB [bacterium]|nr:transcription antitermination protein NusB [bacterium]
MKTLADPRHQARRASLAYLYSIQSNPEQDPKPIFRLLKIHEYDKSLFTKLTEGYVNNTEQIKFLVEPFLSTWSKDQLLDMDILIIELSTLESIILKITPIKVSVDEAVELAKEFGSEKSDKFVNGVLARVVEKSVDK